jgi:hypothetical protein
MCPRYVISSFSFPLFVYVLYRIDSILYIFIYVQTIEKNRIWTCQWIIFYVFAGMLHILQTWVQMFLDLKLPRPDAFEGAYDGSNNFEQTTDAERQISSKLDGFSAIMSE